MENKLFDELLEKTKKRSRESMSNSDNNHVTENNSLEKFLNNKQVIFGDYIYDSDEDNYITGSSGNKAREIAETHAHININFFPEDFISLLSIKDDKILRSAIKILYENLLDYEKGLALKISVDLAISCAIDNSKANENRDLEDHNEVNIVHESNNESMTVDNNTLRSLRAAWLEKF